MVVHQPNNVKVIYTSACIKTKIDYGFDFVFHLMDSVTLTIISLINNMVCQVLPGEQMLAFVCPSLVGDQ